MYTKDVFKNSSYNDIVYKNNISYYLKQFVGFDVTISNVPLYKISIDGIDSYIVILKDDIKRLYGSNGKTGVLRQKQWSIFVFNFINYDEYEKNFGLNQTKKPIYSFFKQASCDEFFYKETKSKYNGKHPDRLFRNSSINYLLHNFIYCKLKNKYRYLFLNSYVYSVIGIVHLKKIPSKEYFSTFYYNTNHVFKSVPNPNNIISQKENINKTSFIVQKVNDELKVIEKNYSDMSSLVEAYNGVLPLNPITSNNYNSIVSVIEKKVNYIITEGTARTGKTIIAMRLLGKYKTSRFIIMNESFYDSLVQIFFIENIEFTNDRVICHKKKKKMIDWVSNSQILIIDEAQRLNDIQIEQLVNNNNHNINVILGDNLQAINYKSDRGIEKIEKNIIEKKYDYTKYYFDYSIGLASNILYSIKYLIFNDIKFNNQNTNEYEINIFNNEREFIKKYINDSSYKKHMATVYMSNCDYDETITGFERWHVDRFKHYPYFLNNYVKEKVMITTYELISRELDDIYIYLPDTISADDFGIHYIIRNRDLYLLNQIYVLATRAKGEINIYCKNPTTYNYLIKRNQKIIKNARAISTLSKEEKKKSLDLQDKISEKGITRLIHFTSRKNLESILKNGIMSITEMKQNLMHYEYNDENRFDQCFDGISLSIQSPNIYLLNKFKEKYKDREYVYILLDPALLYEITDDSGEKLAPRIYCNYNAAGSLTKKDSENIDVMFEDGFIAGPWWKSMYFTRENKEDNETTANQAEIIFRKRIDPKYILDIKEVD